MLAHNVETVPRIFKRIRPAFRYERSLDVITQARDAGLVTKSNLILGMGEEIPEVHEALADLNALYEQAMVSDRNDTEEMLKYVPDYVRKVPRW